MATGALMLFIVTVTIMKEMFVQATGTSPDQCPTCFQSICRVGSEKCFMCGNAEGAAAGKDEDGDREPISAATKAMKGEEAIRFAIEGGADHWTRLRGEEGATAIALSRIMRRHRTGMKTTRWMVAAAKKECDREADPMAKWAAAAPEAIEAALKMLAEAASDTLGHLSEGVAQYAACNGARLYVSSARTGAMTPASRTEEIRNAFGELLIKDLAEIAESVVGVRKLARRHERHGDGNPDEHRNAELRHWLWSAIARILGAENTSLDRAEVGRAARIQGRNPTSTSTSTEPKTDRYRIARLVRECCLARGINDAGIDPATWTFDKWAATNPTNLTETQRAELTRDHGARTWTYDGEAPEDRRRTSAELPTRRRSSTSSTSSGTRAKGAAAAGKPAAPKSSTSSASTSPEPTAAERFVGEQTEDDMMLEWSLEGDWPAAASAPSKAARTSASASRTDGHRRPTSPAVATTHGPASGADVQTSAATVETASARATSQPASASTGTGSTATPPASGTGEAKPAPGPAHQPIKPSNYGPLRLREPRASPENRRPRVPMRLGTANGARLARDLPKITMVLALSMTVAAAAVTANIADRQRSIGDARATPDPLPVATTTVASEPAAEDWTTVPTPDGKGAARTSQTADEARTDSYTSLRFNAYDCRKLVHPKRRVIDVTEIGDCPDSERDYEPKRHTTAAVVQSPVVIHVKGFRCQAWFEKIAVPCGNLHMTYGEIDVETRMNLEFREAHCRDIVETGKFSCSADTCLGTYPLKPQDLQLGVKHVYSWTSRGKRDGSYCTEVERYAYGNKMIGAGPGEIGAYETTKIHVLVDKVKGEHNAVDGTIDFPSLGLTGKKYDVGAYQAGDIGSVFWNNEEHGCAKSMMMIVPRAEVELHMPVKARRDAFDAYRKAIVLLKAEGQVGGFRLDSRQSTCMKGCFTTQAHRVLICLDEIDGFSLDTLSALDKGEPDPQLRIAMQAVTSYTYFESKLWSTDRFNEILAQMCILARGLWWSQVSSAHQNTREMDYLLRKMDQKDPTSTLSKNGDVGYSIATVGGALIVEECPVVKVTLGTHRNCTFNIPAWTDEETPEQVFVDPITHNIEDWPRITVCNQAYPNHYLIGGKWICSFPKYGPCVETPTRLAPDVSLNRGVSIADVESYSPEFYDQETWNRAIEYRRSRNSKEAVTIAIMNERTLAGAASVGGSLEFTYDGMSITDKFEEMIQRVLGPWNSIYQTMLFIVTAAVVVSMGRVLLGNLFRICYLLAKFGWGPWVIPAIYTSIFVTFSLPGRIMKSTYGRLLKDFELATKDVDLQALGPRMRHMQTQMDALSARSDEMAEQNANYQRQADMRQQLAALRDLETRVRQAGGGTQGPPISDWAAAHGRAAEWADELEANALLRPDGGGISITPRTSSDSTSIDTAPDHPPPDPMQLLGNGGALPPAYTPTDRIDGRIGHRAAPRHEHRRPN